MLELGHTKVGNGDEVLDIAKSPRGPLGLREHAIHRADIGVVLRPSSMPRTMPGRRSLIVFSSFLNGSSRQRLAHEIHARSATSACVAQLEQLDVEPAKFFVHRHIRPQYACKTCEILTATPNPSAIIDGGIAAPGLLSWVLTSKYLNHVPLYRLEQIAAREQVTLSRSTMTEWVGRSGVALQPLVDRLTWHLLQGNTLHADETPVAQLDPGKGKTRKAYLWAYRSNDLEPGPCIIIFDYQTGRSGRHAQSFLENWQGHLLVDDYGGYKALFAEKQTEPCTELACWAHARRKFFDLHQAKAA